MVATLLVDRQQLFGELGQWDIDRRSDLIDLVKCLKTELDVLVSDSTDRGFHQGIDVLVEVACEQLGQLRIAVVSQVSVDLEGSVLLIDIFEHASQLIEEGLSASQRHLVLDHGLGKDVGASILHGCLGDGHQVG